MYTNPQRRNVNHSSGSTFTPHIFGFCKIWSLKQLDFEGWKFQRICYREAITQSNISCAPLCKRADKFSIGLANLSDYDDVMWCDVIWCDMMWCDMTWDEVIWCDVMWREMMWDDVSDVMCCISKCDTLPSLMSLIDCPLHCFDFAWHLKRVVEMCEGRYGWRG